MKKKHFIFTALLVSISITTWSQLPIYQWGHGFGGTFAFGNNEFGADVKTDTFGNVYELGAYTDNFDADPGAGVLTLTSLAPGNQNIMLAKYSSAGTLIWVKGINAPSTGNMEPRKLALDGSGNIYLTGFFSSTVDMDAGVGVTNLTSPAGNFDIFIAKYDNNGNFLWAKGMGGTGTDLGVQIQVDGTGNVYLASHFYNTVDFDPGVGVANLSAPGSDANLAFSKYDSNGNFIWAKGLLMAAHVGCGGIDIDAAGNVVIMGDFQGTLDFDPGVGTVTKTPSGISDVFIAKYDGNGNYISCVAIGGSGIEFGRGIAVTSTHYYITGIYDATADMDPSAGTALITNAGVYDFFVAKYDLSYNYVFANGFGGTGADYVSPYGQGIKADGSGNIYICGQFNSPLDLDPGAVSVTLTPGGSGDDVFVAKYDGNGNFLLGGAIAGPQYENALGLAVDLTGPNFYIAGSNGSTPIDLDPGAGTANFSCQGNGDMYFGKYASCTSPAQPGTISGTATICAGTTNTYSVTAVSGATTYTWTMPSGWTGTSTTNSITATASSTSGNITVTANNACGSSTVQTTTVTVNAIPASPGTISGTASMCVGSGAETYTIAAVAGATTYTWSLPSGWSGTSTSNSITATPGTTGGNINVTANNTCGNSTPQTLSVVVNPLPTVTYIQSPSTVCLNHSAVSLGASTPTGGVYSGTAVTGSIFNATTAGLGVHSITYTFTDGNGCVNAASSNILVDPCTDIQSGVLSEELGVYPNPTNGWVTITGLENGAVIEVFNLLGEKVSASQSNDDVKELNFSGSPNGIYFIKFSSPKITVTKKIIKQ